MTLSGPDALHSLDEALRDVRREEDDIARRLARSAEIVAKFRESEGELLRQLAAVRLDPQTQRELSGRLMQAEVKAREMLAQHSGNLSETERQLKDFDAQIAALTAERAELAGKVEGSKAELAKLSEAVAKTVAADPAYAQKRSAAEALEKVAAESLRKTEQALADREQKGRPYRDDPLFMYLWERGYGTRNYHENNLVTWLDGLVAGMVKFPEARVNFAMLNEIPLRLKEHADRQQQSAAAARAEVTALEDAAIDGAGGKPVREGLASAEARIAAIDEESVKLEDRRDDSARQLRELAQGNDPAFSSATATLAEALGREDIKTLLAEARATATGQDDSIVQQIDEVRRRASEEEHDTEDQKGRLRTLATRRRELEDIQFEFRKAGFGSPGSSFGEDNLVGDVLNDFLRGAISAADYWGRWRKSQNWAGGVPPIRNSSPGPQGGFHWPDSSIAGGTVPRRTNSSSGGVWGRLPTSGGSGGGSFSRPRSGSSGNRTTGGFKTGGGF